MTICSNDDCISAAAYFLSKLSFIDDLKRDFKLKHFSNGDYTLDDKMFPVLCEFFYSNLNWDVSHVESLTYSKTIAMIVLADMVSSQDHLIKFSNN